jgi:hypothetical protein
MEDSPGENGQADTWSDEVDVRERSPERDRKKTQGRKHQLEIDSSMLARLNANWPSEDEAANCEENPSDASKVESSLRTFASEVSGVERLLSISVGQASETGSDEDRAGHEREKGW